MGKLFIRLSVVFIAVYLLFVFIGFYIHGENYWSQSYFLLVELCVCIYMSVQGRYHCKYLRWTMYGFTLQDAFTCFLVQFSVSLSYYSTLICIFLLIIGMSITIVLSLRHYRKVRRMKNRWHNQSVDDGQGAVEGGESRSVSPMIGRGDDCCDLLDKPRADEFAHIPRREKD